uniref:Uncharacterized protein n=1 Tax=Arundo donax TaxID=35708 RepID=A0A0A9EV93_ARUDO
MVSFFPLPLPLPIDSVSAVARLIKAITGAAASVYVEAAASVYLIACWK